MIGFSYNSIKSSVYGIVAKTVNRPILPELRKRELIIPGRDGVWDFGNNSFEKRIIEVQIKFVGTSFNELRIRARSIATWLSGLNGNQNLIFDDEPDKYYVAKIYSTIGLANLYVIGETTIQFECEPYAYEIADICSHDVTLPYDAAYNYNSGLIYPNCRTVYDWYFIAPYFNIRNPDSREWAGFGWSYDGHMTGMYNWGSAKTELSIAIFGDVENPMIYQETTSAQLTISGVITAGNLLIDSDKMQVTLNGSNYITAMSGDFFKLQPGANGFFFYGISPHAEVTFTWKHKHL